MFVRRLTTVLGLTGMLLGGSMTATHADDVSAKDSCFGSASYPGIVCFYDNGDVFKVEDRSGDGLRVQVVWETSYGRSGVCANTGGAYTVKTCNYNMAEGRSLTYRMETRNGSKLHSAWNWKETTI